MTDVNLSRSAPGPAGSLWRQRDFLLIWGGQAVSMQGDGLFHIAMLWWIKDTTGSAAGASMVMLAAVLPAVLLAPLAGAVVDRADRRAVLLAADLVRAAVTGAVAWGMLGGWLTLPLVAAAAVVMSAASVFHRPALQASVPVLVPPHLLDRANAMHQMAESSAQIIAPVAGGVLVAALGPGSAVAADTATFAIAAAALVGAAIPRVAAPPEARRSIWRDMGAGFGYLRQAQPMLLFMLLTFAVVNFALVPTGPLLPFVADQRLGLDARGFGLLATALPVGTLAGAALWARLSGRIRRGSGVIWGIAGIGLGIALTGGATLVWVAAASLLLSGVGLAGAQVSATGLFQTRVPLLMQGRVFASRSAISMAASPLSLALVATLARQFPPHMILIGCGLLAALGGLSGYLVPGLAQAD